MSRTAEIVDQLNAYQGDNIWQDLILALAEYDETATDAMEHGQGDRFALADGTVIAYGVGSYGGSAYSPHAAGWYEV